MNPIRLSLKTVTLLAFITSVIMAGCKKEPPPKTEIVEEEEIEEEEISPDELRRQKKQRRSREARKRFAQKMAAAEPFDPEEARTQLLYNTYGIDITSIFPDGYKAGTQTTRSQIKKEIIKLAKIEGEKDFSDADRIKYREKLERDVPFYNIGDDVTISIKPNRRQTSGRLMQVKPRYIRIDHLKLDFDIIMAPSRDQFEPDKYKRKINRMMQVQFINPRKQLLKQAYRDAMESVYESHGYFKIDGKWQGIEAMFKRIEPKLAILKKKYKAQLTTSIRKVVERELKKEGYFD